MRDVTSRQLYSLLHWMAEDLQHPGKQEAYLMQVACEVRRVLMKDPSRVQPSDFQLNFGAAKGKSMDARHGSPSPTDEESMKRRRRLSMSAWLGACGYDLRGNKVVGTLSSQENS